MPEAKQSEGQDKQKETHLTYLKWFGGFMFAIVTLFVQYHNGKATSKLNEKLDTITELVVKVNHNKDSIRDNKTTIENNYISLEALIRLETEKNEKLIYSRTESRIKRIEHDTDIERIDELIKRVSSRMYKITEEQKMIKEILTNIRRHN